LVLQGVPFRDAYKQVGEKIEKGNFKPDKEVNHSHQGSIGNLCLDKIFSKKVNILSEFRFQKIEEAISQLLK
jgi:argininosuccinate lyase